MAKWTLSRLTRRPPPAVIPFRKTTVYRAGICTPDARTRNLYWDPCNVSSAVRRRSKSVIATLLRSGASYLEPAAERISREGSATRSGSLRSGAKVAAKVRSVLAAASTAAAASASWPV